MHAVYLVRHGETTSNLLRTWRTANEELTEKGIAQARTLAARVASLDVVRIVSSTASRTLKTAEIISDHTGLPVEGNPLFYEEKSPTSIQGLVHEKTPENPIEKYLTLALAHAEDPNYHYENEENLYERKMRIMRICTYLDQHAADKLLIVTHGNILKMLAAFIILGEGCTAKELYLSSQRFRTTNTGITKLYKDGDMWRVVLWNDHAHFGEF